MFSCITSLQFPPFFPQLGDNLVSKEVALLHSLKHKFVIKLLDYFETQDKFYVVMERPEKYIDLFDYITQKGTVSERSARYLFRQVVEAVQYCLSQGVLHGDIKDENILIDLKSNQVKLIDFGSSSFLKDGVYKEYGGGCGFDIIYYLFLGQFVRCPVYLQCFIAGPPIKVKRTPHNQKKNLLFFFWGGGGC